MHDVVSSFDTGAATHVGKLRERNEDSYLARPDVGLWTVADGMGGHTAGDFASASIVEALQTIEQPASASELLAHCEERLLSVNTQLRQTAREREVLVLGSTVAVLLV